MQETRWEQILVSLGLSPKIAGLTILLVPVLLVIFGFIYREDFFGVKSRIRRLMRSDVEKQDDPAKAGDLDSPKKVTEAPSATEHEKEPIQNTSLVHFETERKPNQLELQRAIHTIIDSDDKFNVPLVYDGRIGVLKQKCDSLYTEFERKFRDQKVQIDDFNRIKSILDNARQNEACLPRVLGQAIKRLSNDAKDYAVDSLILDTCSRFVELRMTHVISGLVSCQFADESPELVQYARLGSIPNYVAHIDNIQSEDLIQYLIQFENEPFERGVFAPKMFGRSLFLVAHEFEEKGTGYQPPVSFLTGYVFPQILYTSWLDPDDWAFPYKCSSVFVKNLQGDYLDKNGNPST